MKKKILIPILTGVAAISTIASIVTLTSCSCGSNLTQECTITFTATIGGRITGSTTTKVNSGAKWSSVTKPSYSVDEGYTFIGWYNGNTEMKNSDVISSDSTITARFQKVTPITTNFEWTLDLYTKQATIKKYIGTETNVIIPNEYTDSTSGLVYNVTTIGKFAFRGCAGLTSIAIPNTVISIGDSAFSGCTSLASIKVSSSNSVYSSQDRAGNECNCIIKKSTNELISGCKTTNIPNIVTTIGEFAFSDCIGLTSIEIPNGVTTIGKSAFRGCAGLTSIAIPNTVISIGDSAFSGCIGLISITIHEGVTNIGNLAFYNCKGLTSIVIPSSVTSIDYSAFSGCTSLASIKVSSSNSVYSSQDRAGNECNCIIEKSTNELILGCKTTNIPNIVTTIGKFAFRGCIGLTSIEIPSSVTSIGYSAFSGCTSLASIKVDPSNSVYSSQDGVGNESNCIIEKSTNVLLLGCKTTSIPNGVTSIRYYAFNGCIGLTSIVIPSSVTSIDYSAFSGCTSLASIKVNPSNAIYASQYIGNECNCIIKKSTNELISGCKTTNIPNIVTTIGESAFSGCIGLTSIEIPSSVTSIGYSAFVGCTSLTSITIPEGVTKLNGRVFYGCTGLKTITIPSSVKTITKFDGPRSRGGYAFAGCTSLESIKVDPSNSVYSSKDRAGNECNCIIKKSTNELIYGCKATSIPNDVKSIVATAFYRCTGLTSIEIPSSVTSIGDSAFSGCTGLTSISYSGTKSQFAQISKPYVWHNEVPTNVIHCTDGDYWL